MAAVGGLDEVTTTEMARLAGQVHVGRSWFGRSPLGRAQRSVLAVTAAAAESPGESSRGLLAIALSGRDEPSPATPRSTSPCRP